MALLTSEIQRIRYELGYNVVQIANPYITTFALFESVIQQYVQGGATTTSSTAVTAATTPTPVALTLASATGVSVGDTLVVDVDDRQERAIISALSGAVATVALSKAHSGTYPVTVEGGEAIVRQILRQLAIFTGEGGDDGLLAQAAAGAGVKKVDEIEFFGGGGSGSDASAAFDAKKRAREYFRDELASALGVQNLRKVRKGQGNDLVVY